MGKSSIQIIDHPNGKAALIHGVIDGTFDLRPLMGEHEIVLFDLEGVARITSFGVREWRTTLSELKARYVCFVNCHPSLVSQFNLVPGFACGGELISFYLPYVCPSCNQVAEGLLDLRSDDAIVESLDPPEVKCPKCGSRMEFDDIPAAYLKYARSVPRPRPPAAANTMIDIGTPESPKRELSVRKEVEDTVTAFWLSGHLNDKRAMRRLTEGVEGHVVVELTELDGVTDDGLTGLTQFLRAVGEAHLCRIPESVLAPIVEHLAREQLVDTRIVSVEATLRCPKCATSVPIELDQARLATPFEQCPNCQHQLDSSMLPESTREALDRIRPTDPPEAVQVYLQNRSATPGTGPAGATTSYTAPSKLLFGNYRILKRLGMGGMGEILLARYVGAEKFEKLVVIKRIRRDYLRNEGAMHEFQQEARVTARLSHPNIVQIFDFSKFDDEYFFAMEYVNGIDLRHALRLCREANMQWPAELCMRVISDVCSGLEAAHSYKNEAGVPIPIFHRDVSPENIIISVDGAVKLTDFGIAKVADGSVNTDAGVFKGKHTYSAPEQLEAGVTADHRTDIYSTGVVLYEMLSLRRYFGDEVTPAMVYQAILRPPRKLSDVREGIQDDLQKIFERAIASDRTARYQSALGLQEALERLMKAGEYPTSHDLAAWIRKVIALRKDSKESQKTPARGTPGEETVETVDGVLTPADHALTSLQAPISPNGSEEDS